MMHMDLRDQRELILVILTLSMQMIFLRTFFQLTDLIMMKMIFSKVSLIEEKMEK